MSDEIMSPPFLFIVAALDADRLMMNGLRLLGQMVISGPRALGPYNKPSLDHCRLAVLFCYAHSLSGPNMKS